MPQLKLIIFDLDGTLVDSSLDFDSMRAELGIEAGRPILEEIELIDNEIQREEMFAIIHRHELKGALESTIYNGVKEFLHFLDSNQFKKAILTRNSKICTEETLKKHQLQFEYVCTRDDIKNQKPHPEGLIKICESFSINPDQAIYIGDFTFDMLAAKNAKMKSLYFGDNQVISQLANFQFQDYKDLLTGKLFKQLFN